MKNKLLFFSLFVLLALNIQIYSSTDGICGTTQTTSGNFLPTIGTIRVLVVFIQFNDDDSVSTAWPKDNYPTWASGFVNSTVSSSYPYNNLSQYYDDMSNNQYHVIGDVYSSLVKTDFNESHYTSIGQVNYEVLTKIDPYVDFSKYDNLNGNSFGQDGKVDFIYMIYRNSNSLMSYTGIAHLSLSQTIYTNDGVEIVNGGSIGSGVQQRGGVNGSTYTKFISAHEMGHYLLGGGHIDYISNLGLLTGKPYWNDDRGMISWERHRLGWVSYTDKTSDSEFWVSDYFTTDKVYRIPISTNEYYLIENREKLDPNDYAGDKGIYVYYIRESIYSWVPTIDVKCADGDWDFNYNSSTNTLTRTLPDPINGKDEMNYDVNGIKCIKPYYPSDDAGGDSEDAFDLDFNNVFSPKSNPRSTSGNFTMEVVQKSGSQYKIHLYFTNPYAGSPSKPQNLQVTTNGTHPVISWDANTEPDLKNYWLYRSDDDGPFYRISIISKSSTSYIDNAVTFTKPVWEVKIVYKIKAIDNSNKQSVYSNSDYIYGKSNGVPKIGEQFTENHIMDLKYKVINYPNPFNPTTKISYQLPGKGHVILKVYNTLGKEIATLENSNKEAGSYTVNFDASNLPSGLYLYKLQVYGSGNTIKFTKVRKMMLIK